MLNNWRLIPRLRTTEIGLPRAVAGGRRIASEVIAPYPATAALGLRSRTCRDAQREIDRGEFTHVGRP